MPKTRKIARIVALDNLSIFLIPVFSGFLEKNVVLWWTFLILSDIIAKMDGICKSRFTMNFEKAGTELCFRVTIKDFCRESRAVWEFFLIFRLFESLE